MHRRITDPINVKLPLSSGLPQKHFEQQIHIYLNSFSNLRNSYVHPTRKSIKIAVKSSFEKLCNFFVKFVGRQGRVAQPLN